MIAVRFARRALRDLDRVDRWWRANRLSAPVLFLSEVAQAVRLLRVSPEIGPNYEAPQATGVRRLLLQKTQYHVYYRYHPAKMLVVILAIWSTRRGRGPSLR